MKVKSPSNWQVRKKAKRGFRGYPAATLAFYGPDAAFASKVAVGIVTSEDAPIDTLQRWFSTGVDIRLDRSIGEQVAAFVKAHGVLTVVESEGIIGCPHEEGIDYPDGERCPQCPYWAGRERPIERQMRAYSLAAIAARKTPS